MPWLQVKLSVAAGPATRPPLCARPAGLSFVPTPPRLNAAPPASRISLTATVSLRRPRACYAVRATASRPAAAGWFASGPRSSKIWVPIRRLDALEATVCWIEGSLARAVLRTIAPRVRAVLARLAGGVAARWITVCDASDDVRQRPCLILLLTFLNGAPLLLLLWPRACVLRGEPGSNHKLTAASAAMPIGMCGQDQLASCAALRVVATIPKARYTAR